MEMTPETLRQHPPFDIDDGVNVGNLWAHCDAHADAWEADIENEQADYIRLHEEHLLALARIEWGDEMAEAKAKALEARIEELVRTGRAYLNCADNYLLSSNAFKGLEASHQLDYDRWRAKFEDALAGGEDR